MKTTYIAGNTLVMRIRKDDTHIMEWAAKQSELGDAIRFLIEQEIQSRGITDMATNITSKRNILPTAVDIKPVLHKLMVDNKSLPTGEIYTKVADLLQVPYEERARSVRSCDEPQWELNVNWAFKHLRNEGLLISPVRGVWEISTGD